MLNVQVLLPNVRTNAYSGSHFESQSYSSWQN